MSCEKCGSELSGTSRFCLRCGAVVWAADVYGPPFNLGLPAKPKRSTFGVSVAILIVLGLIVNFAMIIYFTMPANRIYEPDTDLVVLYTTASEVLPEIVVLPEPLPEVEMTPEPLPYIETTPEPSPEVVVTPDPSSTPDPDPSPTPEPTPEEPEPESTPEATATPAPTPEPEPILIGTMVRVVAESAHVRSLPDINGGVLGFLLNGDTVIVLEKSRDALPAWILVRNEMRELQGWVYSNSLRPL